METKFSHLTPNSHDALIDLDAVL